MFRMPLNALQPFSFDHDIQPNCHDGVLASLFVSQSHALPSSGSCDDAFKAQGTSLSDCLEQLLSRNVHADLNAEVGRSAENAHVETDDVSQSDELDSDEQAPALISEVDHFAGELADVFLPKRGNDLGSSAELPSAEPVLRHVLSKRLKRTNIALREDDGQLRVYNLVKETQSTAKAFYNCMVCTNLSRSEVKKYSVSVVCFDGDLESVSGEHHPRCAPVPTAKFLADQIDKKQRLSVSMGFKEPFQAYEDGVCEAQKAGHSVSGEYPDWATVKTAYYRLSKSKKL